MSSKRLESGSTGKVNVVTYELLLPIESYWEVEKLMGKMDYLVAAQEDSVMISDLQTKVLRKVVNFVVHEKDRISLKEKIDGPPAS